jgi:MFS family permease
LAGLLVARVSMASAYAVDTASFAVAVVCLLAMRPMPPHGGGTRASLSSIGEGLRYLKGQRAVVGTFVVDINAMVFGMPRALFPAIGLGTFGSAEVVGLLNSAPATGAMIAAATSGWLHRINRQGRAVVLAVVVWGLAVAGFGLVPWLSVALLMLALAGAADVVSAVFRNSILQTTVPDRLRGRLSAIFIAVVVGGPRLGDAEAGLVGQVVGPQFSVVTGGLLCVAGAGIVARLLPELVRWNRRQHGVAPEDPGDAEDALAAS